MKSMKLAKFPVIIAVLAVFALAACSPEIGSAEC